MSLVSYLPPLPPPSPHFSSTDRNLTVANLHVLATQIIVSFLLISFVLGPYPLPPVGSLWNHGLPCATRARSPTLGVQEPAHPHCAPALPAPCRFQPQAPRAGRVTLFFKQFQKSSVISCLIVSLCQKTRAGWPLLLSVTLPCSEGAGPSVCATCRASLARLFLT